MENFLSFTRFLWKFSNLDLIFEHEKFENLNSKKEKIFLKFKKFILFFTLSNIIFIDYIFSTMLFTFPIDPKYLGETFYNNSLLFITIIEVFIFYFNRKKFCEIMKKLPKNFTFNEIKKFNLKKLILRTKIFYTLIGVVCSITATFYTSKNYFGKERKFSVDFKFPFDISHPIVFYALTTDFLYASEIAAIFTFICPIFKFGLIFVTAVEFMKLREEFKESLNKVRKFSGVILLGEIKFGHFN